MKRLTSLLAAFLVLACLLCACDAPQSDHILNTDTQGTQAPDIGTAATEAQTQPQEYTSTILPFLITISAKARPAATSILFCNKSLYMLTLRSK